MAGTGGSLLGNDYDSCSDEGEGDDDKAEALVASFLEENSSPKRKKLRFAAPELLTTVIEFDPALPATQDPIKRDQVINSSFSFAFLPPPPTRLLEVSQYEAVPAPSFPTPKPKPFSFATKTETVSITKKIKDQITTPNNQNIDDIELDKGMWSNISQYSRGSPPPKVVDDDHVEGTETNALSSSATTGSSSSISSSSSSSSSNNSSSSREEEYFCDVCSYTIEVGEYRYDCRVCAKNAFNCCEVCHCVHLEHQKPIKELHQHALFRVMTT